MVDHDSLDTLEQLADNIDYYEAMAGTGKYVVDVELADGSDVTFHLAVVEVVNDKLRVAGDVVDGDETVEFHADGFEFGLADFVTVGLERHDSGTTTLIERLEVRDV